MLGILLLSEPGRATETGPDYEMPVYVAAEDQKVITLDTIRLQSEQFYFESQVKTNLKRQQTAKLRLENRKRDFERAKRLRKSGGISGQTFALTRFLYRRAKFQYEELILITDWLEKRNTSLQTRIRAEGNPDRDLRLSYARAKQAELIAHNKVLEQELQARGTTRAFRRIRFHSGEQLFKRKVIAKQEFEHRQLQLRESETAISSVHHRLAANKKAAEALAKTVLALQKEGAR